MIFKEKNNYGLIVFLSTMSGICGLSYQILYSRILSTYFGSISYVAAAIIGGFLLGIAIGPLIARRMTPFIAHVEAMVGVTGLVAGIFFLTMGSQPLVWVGGIAESPLLISLCAGLIIAVPALLIGLSLPLFAIYLRYANQSADDYDGFRVGYLFYNLGAAICVLLVELVLVFSLGIGGSTIAIAVLNLIVAGALYRYLQRPPESFFEAELKIRMPMEHYRKTGLIVSGALSGIFQILYLKAALHVWGPTTLTVASVITSAFFGIAIGSALIDRVRISFGQVLLACGFTIALLFVSFESIIVAWSYVAAWASETYGFENLYLFQSLFVILVGLPVFILLGSTEPAIMKGRSGAVFEGGKVLSMSAFANAAGVFLMIFWMHERTEDHIMLMGLSVIFLAIGLMTEWKEGRSHVKA